MRHAFRVEGMAGSLLQRSGIPAYRQGATNHCPSCSRSHWLIGRTTAECAFCGTALPIAVGGQPTFRWLANAA